MLSYSELLNSVEWKEKRSQIIFRDKYLCQNCSNANIIKDCKEGIATKISDPFFSM